VVVSIVHQLLKFFEFVNRPRTLCAGSKEANKVLFFKGVIGNRQEQHYSGGQPRSVGFGSEVGLAQTYQKHPFTGNKQDDKS